MYETRFAAINGRLAVGSGGDAERNDLVEALITAGAGSKFGSTGGAWGTVRRVEHSFPFAALPCSGSSNKTVRFCPGKTEKDGSGSEATDLPASSRKTTFELSLWMRTLPLFAV